MKPQCALQWHEHIIHFPVLTHACISKQTNVHLAEIYPSSKLWSFDHLLWLLNPHLKLAGMIRAASLVKIIAFCFIVNLGVHFHIFII